jgi:hypothetical protein
MTIYSQCAMHIVVGPCAKGHFIHAGFFVPRVLLLLLLLTYDSFIRCQPLILMCLQFCPRDGLSFWDLVLLYGFLCEQVYA